MKKLILFGIIMILLVSFVSGMSNKEFENTFYYDMEEGSGDQTSEYSGNSNNGTITTFSWLAESEYDAQSVSMTSGGGSLQIPNNFMNASTNAAWAFTLDWKGDTGDGYVLNSDTGCPKIFFQSNGNFICYVKIDGNCVGAGTEIGVANSGFHSYGCSYDSNQIQIWKDNIVKKTQDVADGLANHTGITTIFVGSYSSSNSVINASYDNWAYYNGDNITGFMEVFNSSPTTTTTTTTTTTATATTLINQDLVVNMTFDNASDPYKDYSALSHIFTNQGSVSSLDKTTCKWYGCGNFTKDDNSDYLNSTTLFSLDNGISFSFWTYYTIDPDSTSGIELSIGSGSNKKYSEMNTYGRHTVFDAADGMVDAYSGTNNPITGYWYHYFIIYNNTNLIVWENGVKNDEGENYGALNYTLGEAINIGRIVASTTNHHGYIDELLIWNRSDINETQVLDIYNSKRTGTPEEVDIYVKSIKYEKPYNWSHENNSLIVGGNISINITFQNGGLQSSGNTIFNFTLEGVQICNGNFSLTYQEEYLISCNWTSTRGFHEGNITIVNSLDNISANDHQSVYIPFFDRPYMFFNRTQWFNDILPYISNSANEPVYGSYLQYYYGVSEDFNNAWDGNNVDPRGKKGRDNAMSCWLRSFNYTVGDKVQCLYAKNHLNGWANRTVSSYSNNQATHELAHVGLTYDLMFWNLTKEENELITGQLNSICQQVAQNGILENDNNTEINGGNGFGFGSGHGTFCYSILGEYKENPTLIYNNSQSYWSKSVIDYWRDRELTYLRSYKNDSEALYQEGWLYKTYSQYHLVENFYLANKFSLYDISPYQNALNSMALEVITQLLDYRSDGSDLRNDESNYFRWIQRGDSNSYQQISDSSWIDWDIVLYYSSLTDNDDYKNSLLYLRNVSDVLSNPAFSLAMTYLWKPLIDTNNVISPNGIINRITFDNANDIFTIRSNYTYVNDTVIQIDGGEERGGGHSQAQGYFLYALGEPFLDYEQVPLEDDVRAETWKNGISLQNTSQTSEGTGGTYSQVCGNAPLNQYYGMLDCPKSYYPTNYPDFRSFPLIYGGDLENYIGTQDSRFAGVYDWKPYSSANYVQQYFIKFGNLLVKRSVISGNTQGEGVYHNFINLYNEVTETRTGTTFILNSTGNGTHTNANLKTRLIYDSSGTIILGGGLTGLTASNTKTGSASLTSNYRRDYYYSSSDNVDMIFSHDWYYEGLNETITSILSNGDRGLSHGSDYVFFDTNGNNEIRHNDVNVTGWGMAYGNGEIGAFNTTRITNFTYDVFTSNESISAHYKRDTANDRIKLTVNTMKIKTGIDYPRSVRVTIGLYELTNNTGPFNITDEDNSAVSQISNTTYTVTFDAISDQNSDYYYISGGSSVVTTTTTTTTVSTTTTTTLASSSYTGSPSFSSPVTIINLTDVNAPPVYSISLGNYNFTSPLTWFGDNNLSDNTNRYIMAFMIFIGVVIVGVLGFLFSWVVVTIIKGLSNK